MPTEANLIRHYIVESGQAPTRHYVVVFVYPDCIRTFDGRVWTTKEHAQ